MKNRIIGLSLIISLALLHDVFAKQYRVQIKPSEADTIQWITPDREVGGSAYRIIDISGELKKGQLDVLFDKSELGVESHVIFLDDDANQVQGYLLLRKGFSSEVFRVFGHATNPKVVFRCKILKQEAESIVFEQVDYFKGIELNADPRILFRNFEVSSKNKTIVSVECR